MQTTNPTSVDRGVVAIVLAAGKGTRMRSDVPKVLHPLSGTPLVLYPIRAASNAGAWRIVVVVGHEAAQVRATVSASGVGAASLRFADQTRPLGTGHAVQCALEQLQDAHGPAWVLSGDVPLLRSDTLVRLLEAWYRSPAGLALATFRPRDNHGYGRILRDAAGQIVGIREERDATPVEREIEECNAGTYCIDLALLRSELPRLGHTNEQGEIYLTDLVALVAKRGEVESVTIDPIEAAGVNTSQQLEELERHASRTDQC